MVMIDLSINNEREAKNFVDLCEKRFFDELNSGILKLLGSDKVKVITLSGPTCSGKTTTANRLINYINSIGHRAVVLSIDDFYLDRLPEERNNTEREAPDYDSVLSIDLEYLEKFTELLMAGEKVQIPKYSFLTSSRAGYDEYIPRENDIYIFEGIQAVYPEITRMFGGKNKSIFITVTDDISYRGTVLKKDEIRLLRRLVRDHQFRDATAEFTLHLWESVRWNEETNIFPNSVSSDVLINSFLPYEPFIIAGRAKELLETVPKDSKYRKAADLLNEKLDVFGTSYFCDRMIPENSVFREFIG